MKAKIKTTKFIKEYDTKFGKMYLHKITWNNEEAFYNSKSKDQKKFVSGQEAEFDIEVKEGQNGKYKNIKPVSSQKFSNYSRSVKREQSKYSGFALAYSKDLVVAGKITEKQMFATAK